MGNKVNLTQLQTAMQSAKDYAESLGTANVVMTEKALWNDGSIDFATTNPCGSTIIDNQRTYYGATTGTIIDLKENIKNFDALKFYLYTYEPNNILGALHTMVLDVKDVLYVSDARNQYPLGYLEWCGQVDNDYLGISVGMVSETKLGFDWNMRPSGRNGGIWAIKGIKYAAYDPENPPEGTLLDTQLQERVTQVEKDIDNIESGKTDYNFHIEDEVIKSAFETASGETVGNSYSLTERKIGTWINGKPIYSLTIPLSSGAISDMTNTVILEETDIEQLIDVKGGIKSSTGELIPIPVTYATSKMAVDAVFDVWVASPSEKRTLYVHQANMTAYTGHLVIEYTKVAD